MSITINTKAYTSYRTGQDENVLAGPANTVSNKDTVAYGRIFAKPTKDFRGVSRPRVKIVRTVTLDDGSKADMLFSGNASIPVGAADADVLALVADIAAAYGLTDTQQLHTKLDINA